MAILFVDELGVIEVKSRPARLGRNLADGEATQIKAGKKIMSRRFSARHTKARGAE
jgi:nucleoid DNA-binding protein